MHKAPVFAAQQIFQQDAQRKGKFREVAEALLFENFQALNIEACAPTFSLSRVPKEFAAEMAILVGPFSG